jgi:hypothetical protein|uniref:hypothetical protein n=1 Tax=Daejeonella sp. TaxID=2805397 RepID=UPI00404B3AB1
MPKDKVSSELKIGLSDDNTEVILSKVPSYIIEELRSDSLKNTEWINFFAIYKDTSDQDLRDFQSALEGTYTIAEKMIRFKPEIEFKPGVSYFARCYTKILLRKPEDIISTKKIFTTGDFIEFKFSSAK